MKRPELCGLLLGLFDAVPRLLICLLFAPGDGHRLFGPLVLARVHHREFDIGHGLTSTHAMAIFIGLFLFAVLTLRVLAWHFRLDGALLRWALFAFAAGLGVTVLDLSETLLTGKVTEYFGLVRNARVSLYNFGDLVRWMSLLVPPLLAIVGAVRYLLVQVVQTAEGKGKGIPG
ncbi:MAG TPA: hypothetical protein VK019_02660 [Pseudomonas sp.]|jgi:hypothetical protein|nr:hypothetical protein [Pseudomonas sp.]